MLLAELLDFRAPRAVPARRLGLAVHRRYHDPRVVGGGAVLREVDVEIGPVGTLNVCVVNRSAGVVSVRDCSGRPPGRSGRVTIVVDSGASVMAPCSHTPGFGSAWPRTSLRKSG